MDEGENEWPCRGELEPPGFRAPSLNSPGILRPGSLPWETTEYWGAWQRNTTSLGKRPETQSRSEENGWQPPADDHFFYQFSCYMLKTPEPLWCVCSTGQCSMAATRVSHLFRFFQEKGSAEAFSHNEDQPPVLLHPCSQHHITGLPF